MTPEEQGSGFPTGGVFTALMDSRDFAPLVKDAGPVAVAVSGGPDSMALCKLLSHWAQECGGADVHALSVDHGLRPESAQEARQVGEWVRGWPHVRHAVLTMVHGDDPKAPRSRIMEKAREGRYKALVRHCRDNGIRCLFLGHHRDDQAETFLFRLSKGSGLDGLAAMQPVQPFEGDIMLLRPLLDFPKAALHATCLHYGVPFIEDPSNVEQTFARPRLRKAQAVLEAEGLTAKRLAVTARRLRRARAALETISESAYKACLVEETPLRIVLDLARLNEESEEIGLRCMLKAIRRLRGSGGHGPRLEKIEDLFHDMNAEKFFRKRTYAGIVFKRDDRAGHFVMSREEKQAKRNKENRKS